MGADRGIMSSRLLRVTAGLAVAVAVLASSACSGGRDVTREDLDAWRALAEQTMPGASAIEITGAPVHCAFATCNSMQINIWFPTYADIVANEEHLFALRTEVVNALGSNSKPIFEVRDETADERGVEIGRSLTSAMDDVAEVELVRGAYYVGESPPVLMRTNVKVFVTDTGSITPDGVVSFAAEAQSALSEYGETLTGITFLPDGTQDLAWNSDEYLNAMVRLVDLPTFADAGLESGCFRHGDWEFDVDPYSTGRFTMVVAPPDAPTGGCS